MTNEVAAREEWLIARKALLDGALPHLAARDVSFAAVSRAPLAGIEEFRKRMGWKFPWLSSHGDDFNCDFREEFSMAWVKHHDKYSNS